MVLSGGTTCHATAKAHHITTVPALVGLTLTGAVAALSRIVLGTANIEGKKKAKGNSQQERKADSDS